MATTKLAQMLKDGRSRMGLSQAALAEDAGVSIEWVRKVEQGVQSKPNLDLLLRVARVLGIEANDLTLAYGKEWRDVPDVVEYLTPDQVTDLNASFHTLKKLTPKRLEEARRFLEIFAAMDDDEFQNATAPE